MNSVTNPQVLFERWLATFEVALGDADAAALDHLLLETSYWRDQIALSWDMQQFWGRDAFRDALLASARDMRPHQFALDPSRTAPAIVALGDVDYIEGFFTFALPHGVGQGFLRLLPDATSPTGARAFSLGTDLKSVDGIVERTTVRVSPENLVPIHPIHGFEPAYAGQTWPDHLREKQLFDTDDPEVLVIGGGHTGAMLGARLQQMDVPYLIVDKGARAGDSWRNRYDSLALHTVGGTNQLPYVRTPDVYPDYIPKDRWADWIEAYVKLMGLNYWSRTALVSARFDEDAGRWQCDLQLADGTVRAMRPRQVVLALGGIGGDPLMPDLPGIDDFQGEKLHSKYFKSAHAFAGKRVLVVGTSTSGHDIALDLHHKGASVTMAQRSPTIVAQLVEGVRHNANYVTGKMSVEEADLRRAAGGILPLRDQFLQRVTVEANKTNAELNAALTRAGLKLYDGPNGTGWLGRLAREFRGFYLNMGCADVIAAGGIKIVQMADIDRFTAEGALMTDGRALPFDAVVMATGFVNQNQELADMFGDDVARRVGPCAGLDATGEQYGNCKPLHQRQLWQMYGGINDTRRLSKVLALQLAAQYAGLVPPLERRADGSLRKIEPERLDA